MAAAAAEVKVGAETEVAAETAIEPAKVHFPAAAPVETPAIEQVPPRELKAPDKLEDVPRPAHVSMEQMRTLQAETPGKLIRVATLELTLEQRVRLAAYEIRGMKGTVHNGEMVDEFARQADGIAPPLFELPPSRIMTVMDALAQRNLDTDDEVVEEMRQRLAELQLASGPASSPPFAAVWPRGTRSRPAMIVRDARHGPIAAASMRLPLASNGVSLPSGLFLLPLIMKKAAAAVLDAKGVSVTSTSKPKWYAEWTMDIRPDGDNEYRYTLLLRLADKDSLQRRRLWQEAHDL